MDTSQYMNMFLEESMDNLQILNESLLELEKNPNDVDKVNEIFRVAHTIKGMAATMGFTDIAELTHKMEDVLSKFREGQLNVTQEVVTVLFDCLDTLERMVSNIEEGADSSIDIEAIIKSLHNISQVKDVAANKEIETLVTLEKDNCSMELNDYDMSIIKQAQEKDFNAIELSITLSENTLLKSARAFLIVKDLEEIGEIIKSKPSTEDIENEDFELQLDFVLITTSSEDEVKKLVENISEVRMVKTKLIEFQKIEESAVKPKEVKLESKETSEEKKKSVKKEGNKKSHQSVRVDLERIDKLMNMVSELVIYRTRLEQIVVDHKSSDLTETLEQVGRTTTDLQDLVMKIRMLPLDTVFNRFPRMIRDISVELNKEINFVIEGAETELDRTVIDEIGEPLIHLLRNAADHGIETKEERIAKGKPAVGTIKLVAYQ